MTKLTIFFIFILSGLTAIAQQVSFSGSVVDEINQPLSRVQILLKKKSNPGILSFSISSSDGRFSLNKGGGRY